MQAVVCEVGVYERALACKTKSAPTGIATCWLLPIQQVSRPIQPYAVSDKLQEAPKMHFRFKMLARNVCRPKALLLERKKRNQ